MSQLKWWLGILCAWALLWSCAQVGSLEGGPRDEMPPQLNVALSTPNETTNFTKQDIVFQFDEYLKLNKINEQLVVSPPLVRRPEVRIVKRSVIFSFHEEEELREDATYVINFGEAIQDLNEGNPAPIRFVFSTGDYIDSLEVSGKIIDALTGKPVENVKLMLYQNTADSVVRKETPFYAWQSDKSGNVTIQNVKADTFKVFALLEPQTSNYKYDNDQEQIGFLDSLLIVTDSSTQSVTIQLSQPRPPLLLKSRLVKEYGLAKLVFNQPLLAQPPVSFGPRAPEQLLEIDQDTLKIWYDTKEPTDWNIFFQRDTLVDTIYVDTISRSYFLENNVLAANKYTFNKPGQSQNPDRDVVWQFNHPLTAFDTSKVRFTADSLAIPQTYQLVIDTSNRRKIALKTAWEEGRFYQLQILPGALTDYFGLTNKDTIQQNYQTQERTELGNIILTLTQLDSTQIYSVGLLKNKQVLDKFTIRNQSSFSKTYRSMEKGKYSVRVVLDANGNGVWDPANYDLRQQPEAIFSKELEELRAGWDLQAEVVPVF